MINRFAVMGNPISHSLSPFIHQRFAEQTGIKLSYEKLLVPEEHFEAQVLDFFAQGGKGLNITLPFKQKAYAMAHTRSPRAMQAKAANTLWMSDNQLHADNTDGIGLIRDLAYYLNLTEKHVLLLGAGGAARGIIGPLLDAGISSLFVVNRTEEKAQSLKADFAQITCSRLSELKGDFDLIINATPSSLTEEKMELPHSLLKPTTLCYDLAYNRQHPTPFVQWAKGQGVFGVDGLGMLVEQAAEAFLIWNGIMPDARIVFKELRKG
ncbi:shikimate dehydrogenase [Legionella micdadei]|uniref:Shikimate dehydrogenase (NADP(+)) n=1 Tax=Legionella micdadei TaxID=451 RepID=A0A098GC86_LEGMI|nr:shikimate dehydrogenase [Legionella micdadei]ARG96378.1 shikimate dehydrogenase [Legionella micdadei]ARG99127.1 shikimate dehydrogenase [Legionella micdadei]KTD29538.1 shikimate 5-dehydrogenase [Legionella micdadei]NSL18065.1 shikimate dehydrogenase [Legionella micdadei]CEG59580.1 Shikimate dehydrogenase [Legionella micdadei]